MTPRQLAGYVNHPWIGKWLPLLLLVIVLVMLTIHSTTIDWREVGRAVQSYTFGDIAASIALAGLTYLIYGCFDLLGRQYVSARISAFESIRTAFISYAINQSLGAVVGGVALRLRLYSRLGIKAAEIAQIIALSVATNWLGYSIIAGSLFTAGYISVPEWRASETLLRIVGVALVCTAVSYLAWCAWFGDRTIAVLRVPVRVPTLKLALLQLIISILHWPTAAAILYLLLRGSVDFPMVLAALLLSAIATLLAHIPAGIGILEGVFVALFGSRVPTDVLLAALLVFRAVFYLLPLALASVAYFGLETIEHTPHNAHKHRPHEADRPTPT